MNARESVKQESGGSLTIARSDGQSRAAELASSNPVSSNPASSNPVSSNPASSNPASSNPASSNPASSNPASSNPASSNPASSNLTDAEAVEAGPTCSATSWQTSLRQALRTAAELQSFVGLPTGDEINVDFPVLVTREFASRMRRGDPEDPLLRQVLPTNAETELLPGFSVDPVGDEQSRIAPGVLHKYDGRSLIVTTGACGVHCRYCFRRDYPYIETGDRGQKYDNAIAAIAANPSIEEVILSGGDPLTLTDAALYQLVQRIELIPHVTRLRLHTRMPIVLPSRVTDDLLRHLRRTRLSCWLVVHTNHPQELDEITLAALGRLIDAGIPVLNQAVLLRSINDDLQTLVDLSTTLINARIMPYYLHQLDRVTGAAHFEVSEERGLELVEQMRSRLPGYAVPTYVREIAGESSKTPLRRSSPS